MIVQRIVGNIPCNLVEWARAISLTPPLFLSFAFYFSFFLPSIFPFSISMSFIFSTHFFPASFSPFHFTSVHRCQRDVMTQIPCFSIAEYCEGVLCRLHFCVSHRRSDSTCIVVVRLLIYSTQFRKFQMNWDLIKIDFQDVFFMMKLCASTTLKLQSTVRQV